MIRLNLAMLKSVPRPFAGMSPHDRRNEALKVLNQLGPNDFRDLQLESAELQEFTNALNRIKDLVGKRKQELYEAETEHPSDYESFLAR